MGVGRLLFRTAKSPVAISSALYAPDAIDKGKAYKRRLQNPTGAEPIMNKISARKALKQYLQKEGMAASAIGSTMAHGAAIGLGSAAAGFAAAKGARVVGDVFMSFRNNRLFDELKSRYPDIKKNKNGREYFDMVLAYAPSLARHPTAIGDFLSRQLQYPASSIEFLHRLADFENSVRKGDESRPSSSFGEQIAESASRAGTDALKPKGKRA